MLPLSNSAFRSLAMDGTTTIGAGSLSISKVSMENNTIPAEYWENDMSRFLYAIPSTLFLVIGTIGNILSFLIYSRKSMGQSVTSVYFRVLAISDTLVLFSGGVVFFAIGALNTDIRLSSEASCKFWIPLLRVSCYHSCWILVFIALDRFVGVHIPHKYRQFCTKTRALILMGVWFLIVLVIVFAYWATILTIENDKCDIFDEHYKKFFLNVYQWFDLAVLNLIPSAILVTVNISIIIKLFRSAAIGRDSKSTKSNVTSPTLILISVSIVYMLCTIPTSTAFIITAAFTGPRAGARTTLYIRSCETLYLANHAVNFFLYCIHGSKFRKELLAFFGCKSKKSLTSTASQSQSTELSVYRKKSDTYKPTF